MSKQEIDFAGMGAVDTKTLANEGVQLPIKRVDGKPLLNKFGSPVGLIILGTDSDVWRRENRTNIKNRMERASRQVTDEESMDALEADTIRLLAACTTGWYGFLDSADKALTFSDAGVRQLFDRFPVIKDQADSAMAERTRFTQASPDA